MDGAVKTATNIEESRPSLASVSGDQWLAFGATMSGWILDAFDYNILAIILIDIQKSFTVDRALASALATVTLVMRLLGGVDVRSGRGLYCAIHSSSGNRKFRKTG